MIGNQMTGGLELKQNFDLLDTTLDAFGADSNRWPASSRQQLTAFVAGNPQAQRRVAAACALDRVLNAAPRLSDARHAALLETIVHKAEHQPRMVARGAPGHAETRHATAGQPDSGLRKFVQPTPFTRLRKHSYAAAALAASLIMGVLSGPNTTVGSLTEAMISGGDVTAATGLQVAQGDDTNTFLDEDLL